jgi:predicted dithiol-disulfide oxidoreductase (DUF899 family)
MNELQTAPGIEQQIYQLEMDLFTQKQKITELRKKLPPVEVQDYFFRDRNGKKVKLSEMFGKKTELMVIHNMGKSCPYCTLWADECNGIIGHLENRVPFAVVSPDDYRVMAKFTSGRKWKFRIYSSKGNSFKKDTGFEDEGSPMPGVSVFVRKDGKIYHHSKSYFGPGDNFCALWHYLNLLPDGANGWEPRYSY